MFALERLYQSRRLFEQGKISKEHYISLVRQLLPVRISDILKEDEKNAKTDEQSQKR